MSDPIKHECGIAVLRLLKPIEHYINKYGTAFYGLNKMYLLMEKQHNRGQDGAGLANIKFDMAPGQRYISRKRSINNKPIQEIFDYINQKFKDLADNDPDKLKDPAYLKANYGFTGELFLGHLRYGTFGKNSIESCHPFLRQNNWMTRNLVVAGNFNLTNVDELFSILTNIGQHPKEKSDTVTVLEKIGHFLDVENERLFQKYKTLGYSNQDITRLISENLDLGDILKNSAEDWDGGYAMAGLLGHGDAFVLRDPSCIRPAYYYHDDEIAVITSERPAIQTAFNVDFSEIKELGGGEAIIIKKSGEVELAQVRQPYERKACSFERIYFSRGSDQEIYAERKQLGINVFPLVMDAIENDIENAVFSFVPNTAETAYYGMIKAAEDHLNSQKLDLIKAMKDREDDDAMWEILSKKARVEKVAIKDAKLRTFITQDDDRDDLVAHVYDISYGTIVPQKDNLVILDDSIVRGTTLRNSILKILDRLGPKNIVVVSSAPQIRYPDCYGIDMAKLGDFVAFQAAIALLKDTNQEKILQEVYESCLKELEKPKKEMRNQVKRIYEPFTAEQVSAKISELLTPKSINAGVKIIYQTIEGLHKACPKNTGDWYFTGDYPTPGGNKVVNKAFVNYMEGINERAY